MRRLRTTLPLLVLAASAIPAPDGLAAQGRLETFTLASDTYGNARTLRVWLPPGYDERAADGARLPVLYLNDGQNLFDAATAVLNDAEWRVDETVEALVRTGDIEPLVVVGVDNAGRRERAHEYLPYPDAFLDPPEPDPQGRRYAAFLRDEVLPAVEARYAVSREPEGRAFGGSSYGALIAAFVAATDDTLFDRLLLESPSFYVDDAHIFEDVAASEHTLRRVYLGVGTNELALEGCPDHEGNREAVGDVERMAELLKRTAADGGLRVEVVVEECAVHHEGAWAARLPRALRFLFGA